MSKQLTYLDRDKERKKIEKLLTLESYKVCAVCNKELKTYGNTFDKIAWTKDGKPMHVNHAHNLSGLRAYPGLKSTPLLDKTMLVGVELECLADNQTFWSNNNQNTALQEPVVSIDADSSTPLAYMERFINVPVSVVAGQTSHYGAAISQAQQRRIMDLYREWRDRLTLYTQGNDENRQAFLNQRMFVQGSDGSLRGSSVVAEKKHTSKHAGLELRTLPSSGDKLERIITEATHHLQKNLNAYVNTTCGTHIHINAGNDSPAQILKTKLLYIAIEDFLYSTQPKDRLRSVYSKVARNDNPNAFLANSIDELNRSQGRYTVLNCLSIIENNSYEIRLHSGTLNAQKILYWIHLNQRIIKKAETLTKTQIVELARMPLSQKKINAIYELLELSPEVRNHFDNRIKKFAMRKEILPMKVKNQAEVNQLKREYRQALEAIKTYALTVQKMSTSGDTWVFDSYKRERKQLSKLMYNTNATGVLNRHI